jgi:hypothetical protein
VAAAIEYRLSGGTGNTSAAAALGGAMSTAGGGVITDNVANNVWDDVSGAESSAGDTEYRCVYAKNSGDQTLQNVSVWIDDQGAGVTGATLQLALDAAGVGGTAQTIANESAAPTSVTFTTPTTQGTLTIANIPAGSNVPIWIKRVIGVATSAGSDVPSITVGGDSNA